MSTFNSVQANPASGGSIFATEQFTQLGVTINLPVNLLAYGPSGGPYTLVGDNSLPVIDSQVLAALNKFNFNDVYLKVDGSANIQPISATSLPLPTGAATESTLANLNKFTFSSTRLLVDNSGVTQPISGTVTANAGTNLNTSLLALDTTVAAIQTSPGIIASSKIAIIGGKTSDVTPEYQPIPLTNSGVAVKVDGSATTQPISATSLPLPTNASTETTLSAVNTNLNKFTFTATRLLVDNSGVTQPISGSVTANAGTNLNTSLLALDSTLANIQVNIGASTAPSKINIIGGKTSDVTPLYEPIPLTNSGAAVKIDGSATTQPISVTSLPLPTGASTETTLSAVKTDLDKFTFSSTRLLVDNSGVTQPVSGTITANIGTTGGLALDSSVNGLLVSQNSTTSGEKGVLIQGAVTTSAPTYTTANTSPLSLNTSGGLRVDGSSVTQPISAVSLPLPTGAATETTLGSVKTDLDKFTFTSTRLLVDGSGVTQPISGTVTANAGTNLNTSLLALESGGNLATIANIVGPNTTGTIATKSALAAMRITSGDIQGSDGQQAPLYGDQTGYLKVTLKALTSVTAVGPTAAGSALASVFPVLIGGSDYGGTADARVVKVDASGNLSVNTPQSSTISTPVQTSLGTTAATLITSNASRKQLIIQNTGTTTIKLAFGAATPTQTVYHLSLSPGVSNDDGQGGSYISDIWQGAVQGISSAASGQLTISEIS